MTYRSLHGAAALALACEGRQVFPTIPGGKGMAYVKWGTEATTDAETIRRWWRRWPDANIGVATGQRSALAVLDIDPDGIPWLAEQAAAGRLPRTRAVVTGRGGAHLWMRPPAGVELKNSAGRLAPGVDFRGDGGLVIAPPSVHTTGRRYAWTDPDLPVAPLPDWLVDACQPPPPKPHRPRRAPETLEPLDDLVASVCARVTAAVQGTRNDMLYRAAFSLGGLDAAGVIDLHGAADALRRAGDATGLPDTEVDDVVARGWEAGQAHPWEPEPRRYG